jgi:Cu(I)/Ag(I) efflux system membrane protein CusA/SilA
MIGGLATSFVMELLIYPAVYKLWKGRAALREREAMEAVV